MLKPLKAPQTLCLTIGDPCGIGPEITARFLQQAEHWQQHGLIVIGDIVNLHNTAEQLGLKLPRAQDGPEYHLEYRDVTSEPMSPPGKTAYNALDLAIQLIRQGKAEALVTGPIAKENLSRAGIGFSGHTEILKYLARKHFATRSQPDMLFVHGGFRMLLLTRHVALREVSRTLSVEGVLKSMDSLVQFLKTQGDIAFPRICMLGLNPHAGELDNKEESGILIPALTEINRRHGLNIQAPVAADAAFRGFDLHNLHYDAYVAAYHDQGLIPMKMIAGLSAVNVTIGLPFLRTSVSHGTAPDIAGQGIADPTSLIAAFNTAVQFKKPVFEPVLDHITAAEQVSV